MKIILEKEEVLKMIHSALCNGGLSDLSASGVELDIAKTEYGLAKKELANNSFNYEDVLVQILRSGKTLKFHDFEEDEKKEFDLNKATEVLSNENALEIIYAYKSGKDDSITGWQLFQLCLYGEIIFA